MTIHRFGDGRFLYINDTFVTMFGYSRAEAVGQTALGLGLWADPSRREELVAAAERGRDCPGLRSKSANQVWGHPGPARLDGTHPAAGRGMHPGDRLRCYGSKARRRGVGTKRAPSSAGARSPRSARKTTSVGASPRSCT